MDVPETVGMSNGTLGAEGELCNEVGTEGAARKRDNVVGILRGAGGNDGVVRRAVNKAFLRLGQEPEETRPGPLMLLLGCATRGSECCTRTLHS